MSENELLSMEEVLDADYDNVVLRVFKGEELEECRAHGVQDRILCVNNGTNGKGRFFCFDCFMGKLERSCVEFEVYPPEGN